MKKIIIILAPALMIASIAHADGLILSPQVSVLPMSSCSTNIMKNHASLPFHNTVLCPSAESYAQTMEAMALQFSGLSQDQVNVYKQFIYYEQLPAPQSQTQKTCTAADGGAPLCNFLANISAVNSVSSKDEPIVKPNADYLSALATENISSFGSISSPYTNQIKEFSLNSYDALKSDDSKHPFNNFNFIYMYDPSGTDETLQTRLRNSANHYWGMSGGGGSGAGFEIKLLAAHANLSQAKTVFTGGTGGGGGMTSPEFKVNLQGIVQVAAGSGGGGGAQFAGTGFDSSLNGLGLGAGTSTNESHINYTYNTDTQNQGNRTDVLKSYQEKRVALREFLQNKLKQGYSLILEGGGGMGVGMEQLNKPTKQGQTEKTPHALSTSGGFKFTYIITLKNNADTTQTIDSVLASDSSNQNNLNKFYQNMGRYINYATQTVLKKADGIENRTTAEEICRAQHAITICMATHLLGAKNTPDWMRTSYCNFGNTTTTDAAPVSYQQSLENAATMLYDNSVVVGTTQTSTPNSINSVLKNCAKNIKEYFDNQSSI